MDPTMFVVGLIIYLGGNGGILAIHSAAFDSVKTCEMQASDAIIADEAAQPSLKGSKTLVMCRDTRAVPQDKSGDVQQRPDRKEPIPPSDEVLQVFPFFKNAESIQQRA